MIADQRANKMTDDIMMITEVVRGPTEDQVDGYDRDRSDRRYDKDYDESKDDYKRSRHDEWRK